MTITGTVELTGRIRYAPPVPNSDWSSNPTWLADVAESLGCSARKESEVMLSVDGGVVINLSDLPNGANFLAVKVAPNVGVPPSPGFPNGVLAAPNPIVVTITSGVGTAQSIPVDGFLCLFTGGVPITALTLTRASGVQTSVRLIMASSGA